MTAAVRPCQDLLVDLSCFVVAVQLVQSAGFEQPDRADQVAELELSAHVRADDPLGIPHHGVVALLPEAEHEHDERAEDGESWSVLVDTVRFLEPKTLTSLLNLARISSFN